MLLSKVIIRLLLNISMNNHEKYFVIRIFRSTCSSVKILRRYMLIC